MACKDGRKQRGARKPTWDLDRIALEKAAKGLTDTGLAAACRVSRPTISGIMAGRSTKASTMKKIAGALGIPLAELVIPVGGRPAPPPEAREK